jgi:hypothetical protein
MKFNFRRFSPLAQAGGFALAGLVLHSTMVEVIKRTTKIEKKFSQGSADDILNDNLCTGDIILFSRKWYMYHLPAALMIKFYKTIYDCGFDHAGVVVMNMGVPYVLETTPFGGIKYRSFESRILNSASEHIVAVRLVRGDKPFADTLSSEQGAQLKTFVQEKLNATNFITSSEVYGFISGIWRWNFIERSSDTSSKVVACPNAALILDAYNTIGFKPQFRQKIVGRSGDSPLTLKDIENRSFHLANGSDALSFTKSDVVVRMR